MTRRTMTIDLRTLVHGALLAVCASAALAAGLATSAAAEDASPSDGMTAEEQKLAERAREYWGYRVGRSPKVMQFYAPPKLGGPTRSRDVSEFGNVGYKTWDIEDVEIDGDKAIVHLVVETSFPLPTPVEVGDRWRRRHFGEQWIKVEGTWYKKPVPRGFSTPNTRAIDPSERDAAKGEGEGEGDAGNGDAADAPPADAPGEQP